MLGDVQEHAKEQVCKPEKSWEMVELGKESVREGEGGQRVRKGIDTFRDTAVCPGGIRKARDYGLQGKPYVGSQVHEKERCDLNESQDS